MLPAMKTVFQRCFRAGSTGVCPYRQKSDFLSILSIKSTVERDWELQFNVPVNIAKLQLTGGELATTPQASIGFASVITIKAKAFSLIAPTK